MGRKAASVVPPNLAKPEFSRCRPLEQGNGLRPAWVTAFTRATPERVQPAPRPVLHQNDGSLSREKPVYYSPSRSEYEKRIDKL